jgi:hypothetical protein
LHLLTLLLFLIIIFYLVISEERSTKKTFGNIIAEFIMIISSLVVQIPQIVILFGGTLASIITYFGLALSKDRRLRRRLTLFVY